MHMHALVPRLYGLLCWTLKDQHTTWVLYKVYRAIYRHRSRQSKENESRGRV